MLSVMSLSMDLTMIPNKKVGSVLFCKVVSKSSLHSKVVLKPDRYEKRCNGFDVAGFTMECQSH